MAKLIRQRYSDDEYMKIEEAAEKAGLTVSAFCKSCVISAVFGSEKASQIDLASLVQQGLDELEPETTFIVSELVDSETWDSLTRSEKNSVAKQLAKKVRDSNGKYERYAVLPERITQYIKH